MFELIFELFPFQISLSRLAIAGISLWSLALYLGFSRLVDWITEALTRWFNFAERSFYTNPQEFEATRSVREAVNRFYASLLSTIPFLALGSLSYYLTRPYLGIQRTILVAMVGCVVGLIHEMGRHPGHSSL